MEDCFVAVRDLEQKAMSIGIDVEILKKIEKKQPIQMEGVGDINGLIESNTLA